MALAGTPVLICRSDADFPQVTHRLFSAAWTELSGREDAGQLGPAALMQLYQVRPPASCGVTGLSRERKRRSLQAESLLSLDENRKGSHRVQSLAGCPSAGSLI